MKLIAPSMALDQQIQAYRREFLEYGGSMDGCGSLRRFDRTQDWLDQVEALKRPETTPPDLVPMTQYVYLRESDQKIVGVIQIRHWFNDFLEKYAGHIGYSVCPSERRKGYATQMLHLVLPECRRLGIERVLVCCVRGNEGSRRTILRCGGVFESTVYLKERDVYLERYWIDPSGPEGYTFEWTDGTDERFGRFYRITEEYYSRVVGGEQNRKAFIPYNLSEAVEKVLLALKDGTPVACAGLKRYSDGDAEVKRVWVEPNHRRAHLASQMMSALEEAAKEAGYRRTVLQTRPIMTDAVAFYTALGYRQIPNYPPYDRLEGAVCFAKEL